MKIIGMIPARGGSSRFNMKPLAQICGKPMLYWVWKHSKEVECFDEVYVATDNEEIKAVAKEIVEAFKQTPQPWDFLPEKFQPQHKLLTDEQAQAELRSFNLSILECK